MERMTCVIVDDNAVDAEYLQLMVANTYFLALKGVFNNAIEANAYLLHNSVQLVFMDIDMPVINGMDYYKNMTNPPICIFVTSHSEYAWEGFEAQAFDYILKPVKKERFNATMLRLQEYIQVKQRADLYESTIEEQTITIKEGNVKHIINLNDILFIEALNDYSKVVTKTKKILTLSKLKHFLEKLPAEQFTRVHRSYAIAINKIEKADTNDIYIQNTQIPIGKTFKNSLKLLL
jgi:DNA-binding LytR/AlgR family response regulator